jgi:uncharacterized membrane protein
MTAKNPVNLEDVIQVIVGSSALSLPVAFAEESWNLSRTLPMINIVLLIILSLVFINLYSIHSIFQGDIKNRVSFFLARTVIDYLITLAVVSLILLALNKLPLITEPIITFKRVIILSFPASMGGVVVDGFDKE